MGKKIALKGVEKDRVASGLGSQCSHIWSLGPPPSSLGWGTLWENPDMGEPKEATGVMGRESEEVWWEIKF